MHHIATGGPYPMAAARKLMLIVASPTHRPNVPRPASMAFSVDGWTLKAYLWRTRFTRSVMTRAPTNRPMVAADIGHQASPRSFGHTGDGGERRWCSDRTYTASRSREGLGW